jgi:hypothetical protein
MVGALGALLALAGCPADLREPERFQVTVGCEPERVAAIFEDSCGTGACHGGDDPQEGLLLVDVDPSALVGAPALGCDGETLVVAGDPAASHLVAKLEGTHDGACGDPMPPLGARLAPEDLACIEGWIRTAGSATPPTADGGPGTDLGTPEPAMDAGIDEPSVEPDLGAAPVDAGAPLLDAGAEPSDAGTASMDAASMEEDAG